MTCWYGSYPSTRRMRERAWAARLVRVIAQVLLGFGFGGGRLMEVIALPYGEVGNPSETLRHLARDRHRRARRAASASEVRDLRCDARRPAWPPGVPFDGRWRSPSSGYARTRGSDALDG
jgi:hypothetical protein